MPQTLSQYLAAQPACPPALATLLTSVATACRRIGADVARGALAGVLGSAGTENVQGETQKKLDVIANDLLLQAVAASGTVAGLASEEMDEVQPVAPGTPRGDYLLLFDPLDGSSNIDVNVSIGTIFSVLRAPPGAIDEAAFLQPGRAQVAAGYAVYGPQTTLVLTLGAGATAFTLDPASGEWIRTQDALAIPADTREFAINASNQRHWEAPVQRYIGECLAGTTGPRGKDFNMRWIASMVADVHRVLQRGGVFLYPRDAREAGKPGKLRLMYEANPMALIVEQAGGAASNALGPILDIVPRHLHERVAVVLGSRNEVERVAAYHRT